MNEIVQDVLDELARATAKFLSDNAVSDLQSRARAALKAALSPPPAGPPASA